MSKDIPIIFSAPMVRALLDGRKTMDRRLAGIWRKVRDPVDKGNWLTAFRPTSWQRVQPGDRLWVRENIWQSSRYPGTLPSGEPAPLSWCWGKQIHYASDGDPPNTGNRTYGPQGLRNGAFAAPDPDAVWIKRPSIHMPRWASRLTLIVTATKIERLQEITEADAIAEGCAGLLGPNPDFPDEWDPSPDEEFGELWRTLHGYDAWDENPEVVAISFRCIQKNIDTVQHDEAA